jgi:hypothetical protein
MSKAIYAHTFTHQEPQRRVIWLLDRAERPRLDPTPEDGWVWHGSICVAPELPGVRTVLTGGGGTVMGLQP